MPKRYSNIYDAAITMDSLYAAFLQAKRGKRNNPSAFIFEQNLIPNLLKLQKELKTGTYSPFPYRKFIIHEPKPRLILAPHFRDVIVQHAFYKLIYPIFDSSFIFDSYGCRKLKGQHKASDRTQKFLRKSNPENYFLQLDIRKFYYSIDKKILRRLLENKIKEQKTIDLLMKFTEIDTELGIPIGNLLSQLFGLIYLNELDHFIKRTLKVKKYVRFVDDFVLFDFTRSDILLLQKHIIDFLKTELNLTLSKVIIKKIKTGINYVGFRTFRRTRLVRKRSLYNFSRKLKRKNFLSVISIMGNAKKTASYKHFKNKLMEFKNAENIQV